MKDYIISQLREHSFIHGKQKTWIYELTDEQLYELYQRLRKGQTANSIAQYVKKAWSINPKSSIHSISQGILKFRKRIAHLLLPPPQKDCSISCINKEDIEKMEDFEHLDYLDRIQAKRIQKMIIE